jgi:hypothetical protein
MSLNNVHCVADSLLAQPSAVLENVIVTQSNIMPFVELKMRYRFSTPVGRFRSKMNPVSTLAPNFLRPSLNITLSYMPVLFSVGCSFHGMDCCRKLRKRTHS